MLFTEDYLKRKIILTMNRTGFIAPAGVTSIIPTLFIPKTTICPSVSPACCVNHILKKSSRNCSTRCCFWTSFARMKQGRGVTEQLKADDRWRRVQKNGLYPQCRRSVCFAGGGKSLKTVAGFRGSVPVHSTVTQPKRSVRSPKTTVCSFFLAIFRYLCYDRVRKRTKGRYGL